MSLSPFRLPPLALVLLSGGCSEKVSPLSSFLLLPSLLPPLTTFLSSSRQPSSFHSRDQNWGTDDSQGLESDTPSTWQALWPWTIHVVYMLFGFLLRKNEGPIPYLGGPCGPSTSLSLAHSRCSINVYSMDVFPFDHLSIDYSSYAQNLTLLKKFPGLPE